MSLKNDIEREFHIPIRIRAGAPGSLKVFLDNEPIYSKKEKSDSPNTAEIIKTIREKTSRT